MRLFERALRLPRCHYCGEYGLHGNVDACLKELKILVVALRRQHDVTAAEIKRLLEKQGVEV